MDGNKLVKNLITGIGGFVASHLADLLIEKGEEVYGTYRWTEDLTRISHLKDNPNFHLIAMDLNDAWSCLKVIEDIKPNYIFHLAAQSYVNDSFIYPGETIQTNVIGTLNLLEAVRVVKNYEDDRHERFIPLLFDPIIHVCSSSEVYGLVTEDLVPINESCRFNPSNPYAVGKVGEDMLALMYYTNYGLKTIRTRMFTHTGPRRTMLSAEVNFAKQIAEFEKHWKSIQNTSYLATQENYILKHGNLNSIRTFADVRDAVQAYYLLVRKGTPGEVYNIGGKTTKTIGEMLDYLISLSPIKDKIIKQEDPKLLRPYDVTLQVPDCSKFIKQTKWKPKYTFEQTMQDLLNWWRTHNKLEFIHK